jgi:transcriptional regulator with XRE-family HTH domain
MAAVGSKLKELRRRRRLAMRQLANRSGVSHSTISLIERDRLSPSVDTLGAILDALGTTLTSFFSQLDADLTRSPFYMAADMVEIGRIEAISYRMVGFGYPNRQLLMLHETYAPKADTGQAFSHAAQEAGIVTRGSVELTVGSETKLLRAGDGYYFDSRLPHRFRNAAKLPAEIVSAITPPTY